jgi:5-methylcytosine-specific restriction endonuclease McrA
MKRTESRPKGQWIRKDLRLAIYLRDEFRCVYCGANLHGADPEGITLDHIKCWIDGGSNAPTNLITACRHCNCSRQDKLLHQYADPHTRKAVRRQARRKIDRFRKLAKSLLEDGEA